MIAPEMPFNALLTLVFWLALAFWLSFFAPFVFAAVVLFLKWLRERRSHG